MLTKEEVADLYELKEAGDSEEGVVTTLVLGAPSAA